MRPAMDAPFGLGSRYLHRQGHIYQRLPLGAATAIGCSPISGLEHRVELGQIRDPRHGEHSRPRPPRRLVVSPASPRSQKNESKPWWLRQRHEAIGVNPFAHAQMRAAAAFR